jgi:hypothetical protein
VGPWELMGEDWEDDEGGMYMKSVPTNQRRRRAP